MTRSGGAQPQSEGPSTTLGGLLRVPFPMEPEASSRPWGEYWRPDAGRPLNARLLGSPALSGSVPRSVSPSSARGMCWGVGWAGDDTRCREGAEPARRLSRREKRRLITEETSNRPARSGQGRRASGHRPRTSRRGGPARSGPTEAARPGPWGRGRATSPTRWCRRSGGPRSGRAGWRLLVPGSRGPPPSARLRNRAGPIFFPYVRPPQVPHWRPKCEGTPLLGIFVFLLPTLLSREQLAASRRIQISRGPR